MVINMVVLGVESPPLLKLASAAGDSSPTSPDDFRQIDDVFLQTQTRIWVGEVLRIRLNEELSIADLLADGELLFEISREVWKMMLSKRLEQQSLKAYEYESFASRNSGRYMPYSYVDSFLKMCKILGLDGIDLFSPSDVVEKRDTRKVCICLRALSKKARSADLNVPDFDIVTYSVAMPTYMVGYIRRSWEVSHCDYSGSSSHSARQRSREEYATDLPFKEFDVTESNSMLTSATKPSYNSSSFESSSDSVNASGVSSVIMNSEGSFFFHRHDAKSQLMESRCRNGYRSDAVDQIDFNPCLEDGVSVVGDSSQCSTPKSDITDDHETASASMENGTYASSSVLINEKNAIFPKTTMTVENEFLDRDDVELSSVGSTNSMSVHAQKLEFEDDLELEDAVTSACFSETKNGKSDGTEGLKSQDIIECKTSERMLSTYKNIKESCFSHGFSQWDQKGKCQIAVAPNGDGGCESLSLSPPLLDPTLESLQNVQIEGTGDALQHKKVKSIVAGDDTMIKLDSDAFKQPTTDGLEEDFNVSCNVAENLNGNKDEGRIEELQMSAGEEIGTEEKKPQKRHILKAVAKGTAAFGAILLMLHFSGRKNGREKSGESSKQSNGGRSTNWRNLKAGKGERAERADGVYLAGKLKLGS